MLTHAFFVARRLSVTGCQDKLKCTRARRQPITRFVLGQARTSQDKPKEILAAGAQPFPSFRSLVFLSLEKHRST